MFSDYSTVSMLVKFEDSDKSEDAEGGNGPSTRNLGGLILVLQSKRDSYICYTKEDYDGVKDVIAIFQVLFKAKRNKLNYHFNGKDSKENKVENV